MAALEYRVLTKILRERSLQEAIRVGLSEEQFKDPEARQIWRFIRQHWFARATAKSVPTMESVQRQWPSFHPTTLIDDADLRAIVHDLKCVTFETDTRSIAAYFQELVDEDPYEAVRAMQNHLTNLVMRFNETSHLGLREVVENAMEHYEAAQQGIIFGVPWPWDCLTEDTLGKRPGDFVVFYARMKQMKTWVLLYCAVYDYLVNNCRVLIWSREMSKEKICLRLASLLGGVDYQLFKKGKLPPAIQKKAFKVLQDLVAEDDAFQREVEEARRKQPGPKLDEEYEEPSRKEPLTESARLGKKQLILMCGRDAPKDLETLQGYIQEYQPDVVYLDSFYHLDCARMEGVRQRNSRLAILAEDVKSMAEDESIPVVAVHQASRLGEKTYGETMADMADSDVIAREADLIARIIKRKGRELYEDGYEVEAPDPDGEDGARPAIKAIPLGKPSVTLPAKVEEEAQRQEVEEDVPRVGAELAIVLPGNREGVLDAFTINAIPGYNFSFISKDYSVAEIEEWMNQDKKDSTKLPKSAPKGGHVKPRFTNETFKNYRGPPEEGA